MKKLICLIAALTCIATITRAENAIPSQEEASQEMMMPKMAMPPHTEFKYYGLYGVIDYNFLMNLNPDNDNVMMNGVTAVGGFQWRRQSGVGLGFSYLNDASGAYTQIPVFVELRTHYLRNQLTPFTTLFAGYSLPLGTQSAGTTYTKINEGGITFGFTFGGRVAFSRNAGMNFFAGYQLLHMNEVEKGVMGIAATHESETFHCLKAGLGFNF